MEILFVFINKKNWVRQWPEPQPQDDKAKWVCSAILPIQPFYFSISHTVFNKL